jgi:non-homologous end joining protein Ku
VLVLDVLHYPAQVRSAAAWETDIAPSAASDAERDLAGQLIALASAPLDWARYRDTSAEELSALIQAKIAQQPLPAPADEPVAILHLLDALKQSVAQVGRRENTPESAAPSRKPRARRKTG